MLRLKVKEKMENKKYRYPANTQLSEEEKSMLDNMLDDEKEKVKKILSEDAANKAVTPAAFMRSLIVNEYKRRCRKYKQSNNGKAS